MNTFNLFARSNRVSAFPQTNSFFYVLCLHGLLHALLLAGFIVYQFVYPQFLNTDGWIFNIPEMLDGWTWMYLIFSISLTVDSVCFYFYEKIKTSSFMHWFYLSLDAVLVTLCLSVMMPVLYSVLMFVYLLQIISAGVISQYKGSFSQALLVGALFSGILALDPGSMDSSLVMSFLLGNLGF